MFSHFSVKCIWQFLAENVYVRYRIAKIFNLHRNSAYPDISHTFCVARYIFKKFWLMGLHATHVSQILCHIHLWAQRPLTEITVSSLFLCGILQWHFLTFLLFNVCAIWGGWIDVTCSYWQLKWLFTHRVVCWQIQDAQAAMRLYTMHRKQWEKLLKSRFKKKPAAVNSSREEKSESVR